MRPQDLGLARNTEPLLPYSFIWRYPLGSMDEAPGSWSCKEYWAPSSICLPFRLWFVGQGPGTWVLPGILSPFFHSFILVDSVVMLVSRLNLGPCLWLLVLQVLDFFTIGVHSTILLGAIIIHYTLITGKSLKFQLLDRAPSLARNNLIYSTSICFQFQ